jgi:hypothetical protein
VSESRAAIEAAADPIARWLSQRMDEQARVAVGATPFYLDLLHGVTTELGCSPASIQHFVISDSLLSETPFPRLVSTACKEDSWLATQFFLSAPFEHAGTGDLDVHALEAFAWDPESASYRFYATRPLVAGGALRSEAPPYREFAPHRPGQLTSSRQPPGPAPAFVHVEVEPTACRGCHFGPPDLQGEALTGLPIMNELLAPWPHWNAGPGLRSHSFQIPERTARAPAFHSLTSDPAHMGTSAAFETLIREGHRRVAWARRRALWERPARAGEALSLLRPLFCEEQINYVAEDFDNPVIPLELLVAGGTIEAMLALQPTGLPWTWLARRELRLPGRRADEPPLCMAPVRGNADVSVELDLVARGLLAAPEVLAVRALDWQTPVFSSFRCQLWRAAHERLRQQPPQFPAGARNRDVLSALLAEVLTMDGQSLRLPGDPVRVAVLDQATPDAIAALRDAMRRGELAGRPCGAAIDRPCAATLTQLGERIDGWLRTRSTASDARARLQREVADRQERAREFPGRPSFTCYTGVPLPAAAPPFDTSTAAETVGRRRPPWPAPGWSGAPAQEE